MQPTPRPLITAVHVVSVPAPLGRPGQERARQLSIGLTIGQAGTSWGDALLSGNVLSHEAVQEQLTPVLVGRPLNDLTARMAAIEKLLDDPERPLDPAVGYGTTLALAAAIARLQGRTMAETIAAVYNLAPDEYTIPILAEVHDFAATAPLIDEMIADRPAAIGYRFTGGQLVEAIGQRGEILQRFARELQQRVTALGAGGYQPFLYFALHGGYGQIAARAASATPGALKSGPVLGFLSGLEQAARPFPLFVEDPVILDTLEKQVAFLTQLRNYIHLRNMELKLVSRAYANSIKNVAVLTAAEVADFIWLDGPQLGSVSRLIEAVGICRAAGLGVILGGQPGESVSAAQASCHIALACHPDFLLARPGQGTGLGYALVNRELALAKVALTSRPM